MAYICQKELTADYKGATSGDHRWCFRPVNNRQSSRRVRALLTALALGALSGCGGDSGTGIRPAVVTVEPGEALIVGAGGSLGFSAMVRDESGRPVSGSVTWTVADPQVATIDAVGIATGVSAGTTEDAPRGMDFLYSANRLNVATSRAMCLVVGGLYTHVDRRLPDNIRQSSPISPLPHPLPSPIALTPQPYSLPLSPATLMLAPKTCNVILGYFIPLIAHLNEFTAWAGISRKAAMPKTC